MFVRLQFFSVLPEHTNDIRKLYRNEINPAISRFRGIMNILLLEPTEKENSFIAISEWSSSADAQVWADSDVYKEMRGKLAGFTTQDPVLRTYNVEVVGKEIPLWTPEATEAWPTL